MALNQDYPTYDGISPSWSDFTCTITAEGVDKIEVKDIKGLSTGTTLEIGEQRGASGGRVMKRTTGAEKNEASMELYASGFNKFLRGLKALAPLRGNRRALGLVHFNIQFYFSVFGEPDIYETRIRGCRYMGRDKNPAEGTDALVIPVKLNPIEIVDVIDGEECGLL